MALSDSAVESRPVVLAARNVRKYFPIRGGVFSAHIGDVHAVDGVSVTIHQGETVGLVGESGCGKTTMGRLVLRLIEPTSGHTYYRPPPEVYERLDSLYAGLHADDEANGKAAAAAGSLAQLDEIADQYSLYRKSNKEMRELRGRLQIVFQDPYSSLSPRMLVRDIITEPMAIQRVGTRAERYERAAELLREVGLNPEHLWRFPHEFSGGQRQRIGIARALARRPEFIVLDEPTSALDVSVQAQILNILRGLQQEQQISYLFISHHLSVVRAMSNRVIVMYLGQIVEEAPTDELFTRTLHPYTQALLSAIPIPDPTVKRQRIVLQGDVPSPASPPSGCRFHTRCPAVMPICSKVEPKLMEIRPRHWVSCHLYTSPGEGSSTVTPVDAPATTGSSAPLPTGTAS
jgi:oligopeptide/dipeptide ABC transporter ATP-binding protein